MKKMTIKWIVIPICFAMLVLLAAILGLSQRSMQQQINTEVESHINSVQHLIQGELAKDAELMQALIDLIKDDSRLRRAWIIRDKINLLKYALQIFNTMGSEHRITHFYFHNLDGSNYLRVHNPSRSGDVINRHTMKLAKENGTVSHGIELGPYGSFTLRVVFPWIIHDELVGFIEFGEEIQHITSRIKEMLAVELVYIIDKQFLDRSSWEEGLTLFNNTGNWKQFNDFVIIDKTLASFPENLTEHTISRSSHQPSLLEIQDKPFHYSAKILPLQDVSGEKVGNIIAFYDITAQKAAMKRSIILQVTAFILVGAGLILFFLIGLRQREPIAMEQTRASITMGRLQ